MENFSYHVPFYVVTGGVKLSGHSSELPGGAVGLYDRNTFSVATSIGNGKEFFFAQGNIGGKDWQGYPITETHKSPFFYGEDVENMYVALPQRIQNEEWVLGYNGAASSVGLSYEKGKAVRVRLFFYGDPAFRFFGGPKEYLISYTPAVDCGEPCNASDCPEGIADCLVHTQRLIDKINNQTELKKFGVTAKLVSSTFSAASANMEKYSICVCDNGDALALQQVKAQYPTQRITRISRQGSISCYEFCQRATLGAPADFTQTGSIAQAICGECPAGTTLTTGTDTYYINRSIVGGEDFSTDNTRQTYADTVASGYFTATTFNGATAVEVVAASDAITLNAHPFVTGQKVTYANGGGTSVVGLTTATDYYVIKVDANTIKLATSAANAFAGTAIAIADGVGAAHTLTGAGNTATFVSSNPSSALIKVEVASGVAVTATGTDSVDFAFSAGAQCVYAAPTPIAWEESGVGIASRRTLKIKQLLRPDCDADGDRLDDLASILSPVEGIDLTTLTKIAGDACADDYTVEQDSVDCLPEDCLTSNVTFTYDDLPAFESQSWEVVPPTVTEEEDRKCGIRIAAGYADPKFGDCSFQVSDFWQRMPLKMEASLLVEDADSCDWSTLPSQLQTKIGREERLSGEYVVREVIMKTEAYLKHINQYSPDPRMREAFDKNLLGMVDRNAFYKLYYVSFKASYGKYSFRKRDVQESFTAVFAFKESDPTASTFEASILDVLTAKSGVTLHVNA